MRKILFFICFIIICIGLNSCTVYPTSDYVYTRTVYYPSYNVYYRPTPPLPPKQYFHKPHNKHHSKHQNKPKPHNTPQHNRR